MIEDDDITVEHPRNDGSMAQMGLRYLVGAELVAIVVFALFVLVGRC